MDVRIRKIIALSVGALSLTALTACGSLQTAAVSSTPNAAQATATAFFNNVNAKEAAHGEPTYPPGTDPLHPTANITYTPAELSPGPDPTLGPPPCGEGLANGLEVIQQYGPPTKGGCGVFKDGLLLLEAQGVNGGPGAIALYQCAPSDQNCLHNTGLVQNPGAWSVYPAPHPGAVTTLVFRQPDNLIVDNGGDQLCFNLVTRTYAPDSSCPVQ